MRDVPKTDESECAPGRPPDQFRRILVPTAAREPAVVGDDLADTSQQERNRVRGNVIGAVVRNMTDDDACRRCRIHVHVVESDTVADDDLAASKTFDELGCDFEPTDQNRIGVLAPSQRLFQRQGVRVKELPARRGHDLALTFDRGIAVLDKYNPKFSHWTTVMISI